jgi:isocitrate dehydrogenase (NAD+)
MAHAVTLIPGDWIGPETCAVVKDVIAAASVRVDWDERAFKPGGPSADLLDSCRRTGRVLMAKLDAKRARGQLPPTVALRKALGTWATVRPVRPLPGWPARFPAIDVVVIRETSEDIYSGIEHEVVDGVYEAVKVTTREACERIARFAFDYARANGRRKVSIVHKANIMKRADGLFLKSAQRVAEGYADIRCEEVIVDALCMRLVKDPAQFDVLLCGNLFGDIVSDLASGLGGGITASPSMSLGEGVRLYANPHGNAPHLVGTGRANPLPMLLSALPLVRDLGEADAARRIEQALHASLAAGLRTHEVGGSASTADVRDALCSRLRG